MRGNGESKLCVKESKLCSWNCCWCLLCEGPGEVPPAVCSRSLSRHRCKRKRARANSREPAMGPCCVRAVLPGGHCHCGRMKLWCRCWPRLSPACPDGQPGCRQVSLPSQALGQQRGAAVARFPSFCPGASPCRDRETRCWALPISAG